MGFAHRVSVVFCLFSCMQEIVKYARNFIVFVPNKMIHGVARRKQELRKLKKSLKKLQSQHFYHVLNISLSIICFSVVYCFCPLWKAGWTFIPFSRDFFIEKISKEEAFSCFAIFPTRNIFGQNTKINFHGCFALIPIFVNSAKTFFHGKSFHKTEECFHETRLFLFRQDFHLRNTKKKFKRK